MARSTHTSDPRTIITPDAFEVSGKLLGFPLASPSRRLVAILVDVVIIGLLTTLPGVLLGVVAAALFFRIWGKSEKGDPLDRAFKWTMGCFGAFVLFLTVVIFALVATDWLDDAVDRGPAAEGVVGGSEVEAIISEMGVEDLIRGARSVGAIRRSVEDLEGADTQEDAQAAANDLARSLLEMGVPRDRLRNALDEALTEAAPEWSDDVILDAAVASVSPAATGPTPDTATPEAEPAPAQPTVTFPPEAEDSFRVYESRIADLEEEQQDLREELEETEDDLARAREEDGPGFFAGLWRFADDLGLGFGWGGLYMTICMVWWKGQTVGKRMLNIRVVRLDGEPLGWFVAFERAGGYAAGFATGLLGFAQIWWDPNRQAIHDKIVGTVVIKDGEDRVPGPWMAEERKDQNPRSRHA